MKRIVVKNAIIILAVLSVIYLIGVIYYSSHFLPGTYINDISVGNNTIREAENKIEENIKNTYLKVYKLDCVTFHTDGTYDKEAVKDIKKNQNRYMWFVPSRNKNETEIKYGNIEKDIKKVIYKDEIKTEDAKIVYKDGKFEICNEIYGDYISDKEKVTNEIIYAYGKKDSLDISKYLVKPQITSKSEELNSYISELNKLADTDFYLTDYDILPMDDIAKWIIISNGIDFDKKKISEYVDGLSERYNTVGKERKFKTSDNEEIVISGGDYGWIVDKDKSIGNIYNALKNITSDGCLIAYEQTAATHNDLDFGTTYVEVSLSKQHLWYYKDGKLILETDVVTGMGGNATHKGVFAVTYTEKGSYLTGEGYKTWVDYWMPFDGGIGLHDASWRNSFGNEIYKTNGSHGCVNMPVDKAAELFGYLNRGDCVIVY